MLKSFSASLLALVVSTSAFAGVLATQPAANKSIEGVQLAASATATVEGRTTNLTLAGAGLRSKKVALFPVKVYVAQLLVSEPNAFVRTDADALASAEKMSATAIQLTFVRDVDSAKVQLSFKEALLANKVNLETPALKEFLAAVANGGDAVSGKNLTLVTEKLSSGEEAVTYENVKGEAKTIKGGAGFINAVLSIWLGVPADDGIANLKKALLQGVN